MFVLSLFSDGVRVPPSDFEVDQTEALASVISAKYINKVIRNVGHCIMLYDILEVKPGFIFPGDGGAHIEIKFRLVVFRPFVGEVLTGKIRSATEEGMCISMDFFDDINIPKANVQPDTLFDKDEQVWVWHYGGEKLFMDVGETIRFKVTKERFSDPSPVGAPPPFFDDSENAPAPPATAPYQIEGTVNDYGLGMIPWWT